MALPVRASGGATVEAEALVKLAAAGSGGFVFDYYSDNDFKYAALDLATGSVTVAHRIKNRWVVDARFTATLAAGVDYRLTLRLNGPTVTVLLNGTELGSFSYYGAVVDGGIGLAQPGRYDARSTTSRSRSGRTSRTRPTASRRL